MGGVYKKCLIFFIPLAALVVMSACVSWFDSKGQEPSVTAPDYDEGGGSVKARLSSGLEPITPRADLQGPQEKVSFSLQEVVVSVLNNNRDIQVALQRPVQAQAGILQAQAAYDPEAFAEWQHQHNDNPRASDYNNYSKFYNNTERLGLRQNIPTGATFSAYREWSQGVERERSGSDRHSRGGAYVLEMNQPLLKGFGNMEVKSNIEISRVQSNISEEELRQSIIKSVADALETYWHVARSRENIRISEATLAMAEDLLSREIRRQGEGISTDLDVHRAREAVAVRTTHVLNARDQHHIYQEKLKLLLNNPAAPVGANSEIIVTEDLKTPLFATNLERSLEVALANRPEMRQADLAIQSGSIRAKYAKHNLLPRLDLVGNIRDNDNEADYYVAGYRDDTVGSDWSVGMVFSVPLGNMKARSAVYRAESELEQSFDEKQNARDIIMAEVNTAIQTLDLLVLEIPQSQRAVEAAHRVVEGEWARFEMNQVGNRDLLQAQELLAMSERNNIEALVRYNIAIIKLRAAEGTLLDHLGVVLR